MQYAELHTHSALSLLDGASLPESLAECAAQLGYTALALTDHDEMGGVVRFGTACEALDLGGILGAELTVRMPQLAGRGGERATHLVLLAETREGYRNIASLVTRARMDSERGRASVPWALVTRHVEGGHRTQRVSARLDPATARRRTPRSGVDGGHRAARCVR